MNKIKSIVAAPLSLCLIGILLALFLIIGGTRILYGIPSGAIRLAPQGTVVSPSGTRHISPPSWYLNATGKKKYISGVYTYQTEFIKPANCRANDLTLVVPYIGGTAITVSVNGIFAGSQGDMLTGNSNIWNSAKLFDLPPEAVGEINILEIKIFGLYEAGLVKEPYLLPRSENRAHLWMLLFLSEQLVWLLCGSIFVMGFVVLFTGLSTLPRVDARLLLGVAAIMTALFMSDFLTFSYLAPPVAGFRRMNVILRHLAALFFLWGFVVLLERKFTLFPRIFVISQVLSIIVILFPVSMIDLKNVYIYTYLTVLPLPVYLFMILLRNRQIRSGHSILLSGVSIALLCVMHDVLIEFLSESSIYISHYGFMVMVLLTTAFIVLDFIHNYRQLLFEKSRAELYREESLRDPMTRVFNRNILPFIQQSLTGSFAILIVDLDDFKCINDTYGHHTGDNILKDIVAVMCRVFRHNDYIVRFGGDEFLVILPRCPEAKTHRLIEILHDEIASTKVTVQVQSSLDNSSDDVHVAYSASIGMAYRQGEGEISQKQFQEILAAADTDMYSAKRKKKV